MNIDHCRRRLLELERELAERLAEEVETAREAGDDQPAASDLAQVDQVKDDSLALAETDSAILAAVRAAAQADRRRNLRPVRRRRQADRREASV